MSCKIVSLSLSLSEETSLITFLGIKLGGSHNQTGRPLVHELYMLRHNDTVIVTDGLERT